MVQEYISTGGPVGSSQLARRAEFDVSSATMRNVMGDLEALGYIEKPHTSAGRVPTDQGYRFFVDTLLRLHEPGAKERELIEQKFSASEPRSVESRLQGASKVLHFVTRHAGVVLTPGLASTRFHRIEFVRLRENRVLAILVGQAGEVQNKLLSLDFPVTAEELVRAANYLNALLENVPLDELRGRIQAEFERERTLYDQLQATALKLGAAATSLDDGERVIIEGTGSVLEAPDFQDIERVRSLMSALDEKKRLLELLDRVQRAKEMKVFIGTESDFSSSGDVSVIASPYGTKDAVLGAVGVIGPTRMDYQRVIPLVNLTAQMLSRGFDDE